MHSPQIFLDSADVQETKKALEILGFLDGQTTNPSLLSKILNLEQKMAETEMLDFYYKNIQAIAKLIPQGSVSIEVYADDTTGADQIYYQAVKMNGWIDNAHIKIPVIPKGLEAAEKFLAEGGSVNFTLVFSQQQAGAIGAIAKKTQAVSGQIIISPFVGRLDDIGQNGIDLVENILHMYRQNQIPIKVLAASLRNLTHLKNCFEANVDIVTLPLKTIQNWHDQPNLNLKDFPNELNDLTKIEFEDIQISSNWQDYDISHPLTTKGLAKFAEDWKSNLL